MGCMLITGRKAKGDCNRPIVHQGKVLKRNCPSLPALCWLHAESWTLKFLYCFSVAPNEILVSSKINLVVLIQRGVCIHHNTTTIVILIIIIIFQHIYFKSIWKPLFHFQCSVPPPPFILQSSFIFQKLTQVALQSGKELLQRKPNDGKICCFIHRLPPSANIVLGCNIAAFALDELIFMYVLSF